MTASDRSAKFGVWTPHHGYFGVPDHPREKPDASYANNRQVAVEAEQLGFHSLLIAQQTISTRVADAGVVEPWTASAGIAEATDKIEIIAAIKPFLFHPGMLAKMALGIDDISDGRFAINLVSGWFLPEIQHLALPLLEHDVRYRYSDEWLTIVRGLFAGEAVTFDGEFLRVDELMLRPMAKRPGGPRVYFGGESDPARDLAARQADVFFINGRSLQDTQAVIEDLRRREPAGRTPVEFALSAFVIARETTEEAQAEFRYMLELSGQTNGVPKRAKVGADPATVMMQVNRDVPAIGTNGGTNAGLVGSYDEVAERIQQFVDIGIELFMIQFQPLLPELRRFAEHVMPRVEAGAGLTTARALR